MLALGLSDARRLRATLSHRLVMKWGEPGEFAPGGRTLLEIVIPTDHLCVPDEEPSLSQREKITLLAPAAPGEAITVSVALTPPTRASPHRRVRRHGCSPTGLCRRAVSCGS
jgi:hypothetical protein